MLVKYVFLHNKFRTWKKKRNIIFFGLFIQIIVPDAVFLTKCIIQSIAAHFIAQECKQ